MNQKFSDWAGIAEIVSSVAVVVTLVFLVLGIRKNAAMTRAEVYDRNISSVIDWRRSAIEDPDLTRIWVEFSAGRGDALSVLEPSRLNQLLMNLFNIYEKAYYANQYGIFGESEWSRFENAICTFHGLLTTVPRIQVEEVLTDEFKDFAAGLCAG